MSTPSPAPREHDADPTSEAVTEPADAGGSAVPWQAAGAYQADAYPPVWGSGPTLWPGGSLAWPRQKPDLWWVKGLVGLATAIVVAAIGFPLGAAWSAIAPWLPGIKQSDGVFLVDIEGEQRAAQEGWFVALSIVTGLVVGVLAWMLLRRFRGSVTAAALAVGGAATGWIAWWFGHDIGRAHAMAQVRTAKIGTIIKFPVDLRIKNTGNVAWWHGWFPYVSGLLMSLAITALFVYTLLAGFSTSPSLYAYGRPDRAPRPVTPPSGPPPHTQSPPSLAPPSLSPPSLSPHSESEQPPAAPPDAFGP